MFRLAPWAASGDMLMVTSISRETGNPLGMVILYWSILVVLAIGGTESVSVLA
ncbi:hypothetical protein D3C81_2238200 [compost metagenome]